MTGATRGSDWRSVARIGAPMLASCVGVGVSMGVAWALLAPRTQLAVKDGEVVYARVTEAAIAADLIFAILGIACGVVVSLVLVRCWRSAGPELAVFVAAGGAIGSVVAMRVGLALAGGDSDTGAISANGHAEGVAYEGPLQLDSPGALGMWSLAGLLVVLWVLWRRTRASARRIDEVRERIAAFG